MSNDDDMNQYLQSYPVPFPLVNFAQPPNQPSPGLLDNDPPARVRVALDVLTQFSIKITPKAAATEYAIEWADTPKLTANEIAAQGAACNLLIKYFAGDLKPDRWEAIRLRAANKEIAPTEKLGILSKCYACAPEFVEDCKVCQNKRTILVYPTS